MWNFCTLELDSDSYSSYDTDHPVDSDHCFAASNFNPNLSLFKKLHVENENLLWVFHNKIFNDQQSRPFQKAGYAYYKTYSPRKRHLNSSLTYFVGLGRPKAQLLTRNSIKKRFYSKGIIQYSWRIGEGKDNIITIVASVADPYSFFFKAGSESNFLNGHKIWHIATFFYWNLQM